MLSQMNACIAKFVFEVPTWILLSQTNACVAIFEVKLDHAKPNECVQSQIIRTVVRIENTKSCNAVVHINVFSACKMAGHAEKRTTSVRCIPGLIKFGVVTVCVRKVKAFSENNENGENNTLVKACSWKVTYCV